MSPATPAPTAPAAAPATVTPVPAPTAPAPEGTTARLAKMEAMGGVQPPAPPTPPPAATPPPPTAPVPAKKTVTLDITPDGRIENFEQIADLKVDIKVDGKESVETLTGLRRGYQVDSHLSQKGQRLAERETALKALEQDLIRKVTESTESGLDPKIDSDDPAVKAVLAQNRKLAKDLKALAARVSAAPEPETPRPDLVATPQENYEKNLQAIDAACKARGFTDFRDLARRVESHVMGLPPAEQRLFNTVERWVGAYLEVKAKLAAAPSVPVVGPNLTTVEPGGGGGGGPALSALETWQRNYDAALAEAKRLSWDPTRSSQADEAWAALDALKRTRPQA